MLEFSTLVMFLNPTKRYKSEILERLFMIIKGYDVNRESAVQLTLHGGKIKEIQKIDEVNLPYISTGFVDLQVNGYCGADYSSDKLTVDDVYSIVSELTCSGTTCHLPTIITGDIDKTINNILVIVNAVKRSKHLRNAIAGIHLEGPFISPLDGARGAHDIKFVKKPSIEDLHRLQDAAGGMIKIITIAPETEGAIEFIHEAGKRGIKIAMGHSSAKPDEIKDAIDNGLSLSTHLGNGIPQIIDRRENQLWTQLSDDRIKSGIISDGFHLTREQLIVFQRAKSLENLFLVSDVGPMAGKAPGIYKWGNIDVEVHKDGHLGLAGTPYLAGAGHLLDWSIAHFVNLTGNNIQATMSLVTDIPSGIIDNDVSLNIGSPADIILFSFKEGDARLNIEKTIIDGRVVYDN